MRETEGERDRGRERQREQEKEVKEEGNVAVTRHGVVWAGKYIG